MKKILFALCFAPVVAVADDYDPFEVLGIYPTPPAVYGIPIQPVLPVPRDNGPWGQGYSIVTTTREQRHLYDRDLTGSETVQRIVPNDALGQPIRGIDPVWQGR